MTAPLPRPVNERAYWAAVASFGLAIVGGIVAAIGYGTGHDERMLGGGLAVALGGIGVGLVAWAKYLDLDEHVEQAREPLQLTEADQAGLREEVELTRATVGRRRLLLGLFGGSFLALLIGFFGPVGSLGPKPRGERGRTSWTSGARLVTADGTPIARDETGVDQLATVFPENDIGRDDSQVILIRVAPGLLSERTLEGGALDGWVAYSKICTHAGCSVGLFGVDNRPPDVLRQLVCPCHQSIFDPLDGARPVGGPATRSLPQLPLDADADGFLVARRDFDIPVGPLAWDEA